MCRKAQNVFLIAAVFILTGTSSIRAQPSNDLPCTAELLVVGSECNYDLFTNLDGTDSGIPLTQCEGYSGGDVWFKIEVPASGSLVTQIESEAIDEFPNNDGWAYRLGLAVYRGSCSTLSHDTCWIDPAGDPPVSPTIVLKNYPPGDTLFLRVWEHSNNTNGNFRICAWNPAPEVFNVSGSGSRTSR